MAKGGVGIADLASYLGDRGVKLRLLQGESDLLIGATGSLFGMISCSRVYHAGFSSFKRLRILGQGQVTASGGW
jgi:hypothetical protein